MMASPPLRQRMSVIELTYQEDLPETMACAAVYKVRLDGLTVGWLHCNRSHMVMDWTTASREWWPDDCQRNWWIGDLAYLHELLVALP